jgi:hypothetical protein
MIISNKQLQLLLLVLKDSVSMNIHGLFSSTHEKRLKLLNEIYQQQSEELKEIK